MYVHVWTKLELVHWGIKEGVGIITLKQNCLLQWRNMKKHNSWSPKEPNICYYREHCLQWTEHHYLFLGCISNMSKGNKSCYMLCCLSKDLMVPVKRRMKLIINWEYNYINCWNYIDHNFQKYLFITKHYIIIILKTMNTIIIINYN